MMLCCLRLMTTTRKYTICMATRSWCLLPRGDRTGDSDEVSDHNNLVRMGRKYIINKNRVFHMNALKQTVSLYGSNGQVVVLNVSKPALKSLMQDARSSYATLPSDEPTTLTSILTKERGVDLPPHPWIEWTFPIV